MTPEEALWIISVGDRDVGRVLEAMSMAAEALKRQVPTAPRHKGKTIICPVCRWAFGSVEPLGINCCPGCGQRILWSE